MTVAYADNGPDGLEMLRTSTRIDVVLMDVMMPGMDGYETIRQIRQMGGHADVPIIAVTAKAMKGDREKCLEAGASDYIAKPVDTDQLASLIRVWVGEPGREWRKCDPAEGVTLRFTIEHPPGLKEFCQALVEKGPAASSVASAIATGTAPTVRVEAVAGHRCG